MRVPRRFGQGALLVALGCGVGSVKGQAPCELSLIFQYAPVDDPKHVTPELFANFTQREKVVVPAGATGSVTMYVGMVSRLQDGALGGIQGWVVALGPVAESGIRITGATTDGTAVAGSPEGLFSGGFNKTQLLDTRFEPCVSSGVVSAVVLSFVEPVTLPAVGTSSVLAFTAETSEPQGPEPTRTDITWLTGGGCSLCPRGLPQRACGQPVIAGIVTVAGATRLVCDMRSMELTFVAKGAHIRRGDANSDARVDLSDAVRIFMYLFLGAADPSCLDTADTNDTGCVDLSDGILILNDLFRPGTGISAPGPFTCGADPTSDDLGCREYSPCE